MYSVYVPWFFTMGVSPFGYLRVEAHLQLTAAFRSLSRPSSAPDAKAFALCSYSLELPLLSLYSFVLVLELLEFHKHFLGCNSSVKKLFLLYLESLSTFR